MPEITVLVPSYNHAPFIGRALRSIFGQTLRPKQLIVIDDGSKDESASIIERVLKDCPFESEFIVRENRGLCSTLNEGLAKSDGEYFAYLGSDDVWLPAFLEEQTALLESRPNAVLAFSHAYLIDEDDNIIDRTDNWTSFADHDMLPTLLRGEIFSSPGVVYRRDALEKYGWNKNAVLEDYELYLNLSFDGEFARNTNVISAWRQHKTNMSYDFPLMLKEQLAAQNRVFDRLKMTREEFDRTQTELKFRSVANYIRGGYKREARPLFWSNLSGAGSLIDIAKTFFRLSVPQGLFQWNRLRKRRKAISKYGKLDL